MAVMDKYVSPRITRDGPEDQRGGSRRAQEEDRALAERLPEDAWSEVLPVEDSGERRPWQWACLELAADPENKGMSRWLLARRGSDDPDDLAFYQTYGREDTSVEELVRVCQERWAIEFAFEEAKGEIGMDHYEVRKWGAWHRYVTLCLLAHAFLVVTRLAARNKEVARKKGILGSA
jgi:SRSO17 transposase